MKHEIIKAFAENVKITTTKDGRVQINCKKGLWCVDGHDLGSVKRKALHYFKPYYRDGEYSSIADQIKAINVAQAGGKASENKAAANR